MTVTPIYRDDMSSAELVALAQQGDAEAFGRLYDRYIDKVFHFIYFRTNRNQHLAEDLTADTFHKALKNIGTWSYIGKDVGCWLYTIARRLIIDHHKSCQARLVRPVPDPPDGVLALGHSNISRTVELQPENTVAAHLLNVELLEAVQKLRDDQREVIILRFLLEETVDRTAQIMGNTPGAIKQMQVRALRNLRGALPHLAAGVLAA